MFVVHRHGHVDTDLDISAPDATVGQVAEALLVLLGQRGPRPTSAETHTHTLRIDGAVADPRRRFATAGAANGAVVEVVEPALGHRAGPPPARSPWVLGITGGLLAGRRQPLVEGSTVVGRAPGPGGMALPDPTVSARHVRVGLRHGVVSVEDLGTRNGTWLDGACATGTVTIAPNIPIELGASRLTVLHEPLGNEPARAACAPSGAKAFHRPPRRLTTSEPVLLPLPSVPVAPASAVPVGVAAVVLPLLFGLCLMWLLHSVLWGLLTALGPLLLLAASWEQRRRRRRGQRRATNRFRRDVGTLSGALVTAAGVERARLEATAPDLAVLISRLTSESRRLWECRPTHHDFLVLRLGTGTVTWDPPVEVSPSEPPPLLAELLARHSVMAAAPVLLPLSGGAVLGLVGDDEAAEAVARSLLLQSAIRHGPADLRIAVLTDADRAGRWRWAQRLPHAQAGASSTIRVAASEAGEALARELRASPGGAAEHPPSSPTLLVVVDAPGALLRRRSAVRTLLADPTVCAVVLGGADGSLPAACTATVGIDADGLATLDAPGARPSAPLVCMGVDEATAAEAARLLAAWDDPELAEVSADLPAEVALDAVLPFDATDPRDVVRAWQSHERGLSCPIGMTADGILPVDLVADGPHSLVAGTTGAGKSELLRTIVLGLAATHGPEDLEIALIDFKGGSTFGGLSALPHVVGTATDLDGTLARRAVLALEGELRRRELLLERSGAGDIAAYRAIPGSASPLPRLVVVIDEFATLAADHPDVLDGFVSVAQRGRSLGLHLVLATQRPTGSVNDHLRANTNLRIALRVQDPADSRDVLDVPDAAEIRRDQPGRALVRFGPGELVPVQVATIGACSRSINCGVEMRLRSVPTCAPPDAGAAPGGGAREDDAAVSIAAMVSSAQEAQRRRGGGPAPALWPDPLPDRIGLEELWRSGVGAGVRVSAGVPSQDVDTGSGPLAATATAGFAVADDPAMQRRQLVRWGSSDGNLLVLGAPGSGSTGALAAACLSAARQRGPHALHIYVLAMGGAGVLQPLAGLAHTGAVVGPREGDRRRRMLRYLRAELDERHDAGGSGRPAMIVVIDGAGALLAAHDDPFDPARATIERLLSDGPGVGIQVALSAERPGALPPSWMSVIRQRLVLHLAEPADTALAGVPRGTPLPPVPGRGWWSTSDLVAQVGDPADALAVLAARPRARLAMRDGGPRPVGELPERVRAADLSRFTDAAGRAVEVDREPLLLPVGIAESDLRPASLALHPGDHALVIGPPRSGRSSLLAGLAELACAHPAAPAVAMLAARGRVAHPWPEGCVELDRRYWVDQLSDLAAGGGPVLALIDDGHRLDGEGLRELLQEAGAHLHLVVSVANTALRASFGHWTRRLTESRTAVLLCPDVDLDGELLGVHLPRRAPAEGGVGRGWLVADGTTTYLQALG